MPDAPQVSAGLGILALALLTGQWLVFRYIVRPERDEHRAESAAIRTRLDQLVGEERARGIGAVADERARTHELQAEVQRQNAVLVDKVLPALVSATDVVRSSQALLEELRLEREFERREARRDSEGR